MTKLDTYVIFSEQFSRKLPGKGDEWDYLDNA